MKLLKEEQDGHVVGEKNDQDDNDDEGDIIEMIIMMNIMMIIMMMNYDIINNICHL